MVSITHDEKIAKQEEDDGNLSDNVWFYRSSNINHYHEDASCTLLNKEKEELEQITRKKARNRWVAPCSRCVL